MDILQIWSSYQKDADVNAILDMYKQCPLDAKANGYGDLNLLHIASQNAHYEAVKWLLEQGLKPNEPSGYGDLPLFLLARKGFSQNFVPKEGEIYKTAQALLDAGASTMRRDSYGKYCYLYAAENGNVEFLRALVDKGVKVNKADENGNTALHLITQACYNPLQDLQRANNEIKEKLNEDSLPVKMRSPISMEELQKRKKRIEDKLEDLFRCAEILLEAGVDPEAENDMLETAHKLSVRVGAKKLSALLDGSYSPDEQNKIDAGGMTLHEAVRKSDESAVRALVAMGEDINAISEEQSFEGLTPLAVACQTCDIAMAQLLFELGADASHKNGHGEQPIVALFGTQITIHAPRNLYKDRLAEQLVDMFVKHGFDLNSNINDNGDCLLGLACSAYDLRGSGRDSVIDMVVEKAISLGADVNRKNDAGQTPLMLCCGGDFRTMEEVEIALLEAGADVNLRDVNGNTAFHYAAYKESVKDAVDMVQLMLDFGEPDGNTVNASGKTAMDYAVERDNTQLVKLLLPYTN